MNTSVMEGVIKMPDDPDAKVISWLPAAHIAERGANYYTPVVRGFHPHLPGPPPDHRVPAEDPPDLVLRRPAHLGEAEGRSRRPVRGLPDEQRERAPRRSPMASRRSGSSRPARRSPEDLAAVSRRPTKLSSRPARHGRARRVRASTSAPPDPVEVLEFFHGIGLPLGELWGMSETCGVSHHQPAERHPHRHRGTAGSPNAKSVLAEDGEVLIRGDHTSCPSYRNKPEKTAETIVARLAAHR